MMDVNLLSALYVVYLQVYAWGCGSCLGCGSAEATALRPQLVEELQNQRVVDIACGDSHCLALTNGKDGSALPQFRPVTLAGHL